MGITIGIAIMIMTAQPPKVVDSTWCPVFSHDRTCVFRVGPWRQKRDYWIRARKCRNHKTTQHQFKK